MSDVEVAALEKNGLLVIVCFDEKDDDDCIACPVCERFWFHPHGKPLSSNTMAYLKHHCKWHRTARRDILPVGDLRMRE